MLISRLFGLLAAAIATAATASQLPTNLDSAMQDIRNLSADEMRGRETGTDDAAKAREYIAKRFAQAHLTQQPYLQPFDYEIGFSKRHGVNVVGHRQGCVYPDHFIVVTAHYDHLGKHKGAIYNGADDNASGVAGLLYLAMQTKTQCPAYSMVFVATDAEELGLYGAKAYVDKPSVPLDHVVLNINLDMISRGERGGKLYVAGTRKQPLLQQLPKLRTSEIKLIAAHDKRQTMRGQNQSVDWPNASDHAPFRKAGIPYLYFGVDVHPQYHTPEDDWSRISPDYFSQALQWIDASVAYVQTLSPAQWQSMRQPK